uniref:Uncharacterized protein n=1 Tax=Anopheles dirus TaxID=7168 RepID=A0A182NF34_9DIPT
MASDIDVNQTRVNVIPSKKNANLGFKVFADDGESTVQKVSFKNVQPSVTGETIQKIRTNNVLDDVPKTCMARKGAAVPAADAQTVSGDERLTQQLAMMLIESLEDKPQTQDHPAEDTELRRNKAVEAMRVEQERQKRRNETLDTAKRPNRAKNQPHPGYVTFGRLQPPSKAFLRNASTSRGQSSSSSMVTGHTQRGGYNYVYKYPAEPEVPIRYNPEEIWKLNYHAKGSEAKAEYVVQGDLFTNMGYFTSD